MTSRWPTAVCMILVALGLAGCFESHTTLDPDAGAEPTLCESEADAGRPDIQDCEPREFGAGFHEFELCLPAQVNIDDVNAELSTVRGRGLVRCGFAIISCMNSRSAQRREIFGSFSPRECPEARAQCSGCFGRQIDIVCPLLGGGPNPYDPVQRGVHTLRFAGYEGELQFLITRDPTLPATACATFFPAST